MRLATYPTFTDRPSILLYFEVAMNNRLFGHTLREVYLPFFARMAKLMDHNLVFVSTKVNKLEYFEKHSPPCDAIAIIDDSEASGPPETFTQRFTKLNLTPLQATKPARLVALTTPLVLREDIKRKDRNYLFNMKQSTMESINSGWVMLLGGMWLAEQLNLPLEHVIVDPLEADYRDVVGFNLAGDRFFLYASTIFGARSLQIAESHYRQLWLQGKTKKPRLMFDDEERGLDLLVGYSITQKPRLWLQAYDFDGLLAGSGLKYRVCLKDSFRDIDTFVWKKEEYLALLNNSKFTVIIPSYEERAFSTIRFIEALYQGAIPLILDRCNMSEAFTPAEQEMLKPMIINDKNVVEVIRSINYSSTIKQLQTYFLETRPLAETI